MKGVVALAVTAFAAQIASAQEPRIRDSASVRIVENGPRLTAPIAFELAARPSFDAGGLKNDPAEEFFARNYYLKGARLSDGRIVVIDQSRVHFYDAAGKRLKTVGREGRGPGEYRQATDICVARGDTILIGQTRGLITRLTRDGDLIEAIPPLSGYPEGQFCFDDGTFVTLNPQRGDLGTPTPVRVERNSFSRPMNTVGGFTYPPYDPLVYGSPGQAARGNRFYVAEPHTFEIRGYSAEGKLELIIRTSDQPVAITDADKMKMPVSYRMGSTPAQIEQAKKDAIAKSRTKHWPTLRNLMIDGSGRIWIEAWTPSFAEVTQPTTWSAFDATGRLLGRLIVPGAPAKDQGHIVMGFGANEIFMRRVDDDGAPHLTVIPIVPVKR